MPRVRRVDCSGPGIRRIRRGRGFSYVDEDGGRVSDPDVIDRIAALAIPPAWTGVWICPDPRGHIQATGVDAAGRKQYRYHDAWRQRQDELKFGRMLEFGAILPRARKAMESDLAGRGLTRQRVLACTARLLDLGFFRIGSERYAEENETYGLATMHKRHVRVNGREAVFDYTAKGGLRHVQAVADPLAVPVIRALKQRRGGGRELFAYWQSRHWVDVKSDDINDYLATVTGGEFTAKDFRTWNATVLAAVALARRDDVPQSKTARRRASTEAVREVATYLNNTPAVCRSAYIDPRVFDRYDSGETIHATMARLADRTPPGEFPARERIEKAVLDLLR